MRHLAYQWRPNENYGAPLESYQHVVYQWNLFEACGAQLES